MSTYPPVNWRPFCGNTACPCMEPDMTGPCGEFVDTDPGERRCGRCGWPDVRHADAVPTDLYGRAKSNVKPGEYVYYRQLLGQRLEQFIGGRWVAAHLDRTFLGRYQREGCSPLEVCSELEVPSGGGDAT